MVYVFQGEALVGASDTRVGDGQLARLGAGDTLRLRGSEGPSRLLLLAGVPLNEPMVRHGPFVMNSRSEILQAVEDFQSGRMGEITRTAEVSGSGAS